MSPRILDPCSSVSTASSNWPKLFRQVIWEAPEEYIADLVGNSVVTFLVNIGHPKAFRQCGCPRATSRNQRARAVTVGVKVENGYVPDAESVVILGTC